MANLPVGSSLDFQGNRKILNLPPGVANGQPIIYEQLNAAIEGLGWKDNVRVDATVNINLASPGASINGIAMAIGDRFLPRAQTDTKEPGIYIWNGAAVPATRSADANTFEELENAVVVVDEGPNAGAAFRQTQVNGVLGTNNVVWASFVSAAPVASESTSGTVQIATQAEVDAGTNDTKAVTPLKLANYANRFRKNSATIGDGSATQYTVTHNFGTRDVDVEVIETSGNFRKILTEIRMTSINAVDILFDTPPTSGQYRVVIGG